MDNKNINKTKKVNKNHQIDTKFCLFCDKVNHEIHLCRNLHAHKMKTASSLIEYNLVNNNEEFFKKNHKNYAFKCYFCKQWGHKIEYCFF